MIYIKFYSMKVAGVQCDCKSSPFPTHVSQGGHCFSTSLQVQLYLAEFHQQNANVGVVRGVVESANRHDILLQAYKSATIIVVKRTGLTTFCVINFFQRLIAAMMGPKYLDSFSALAYCEHPFHFDMFTLSNLA